MRTRKVDQLVAAGRRRRPPTLLVALGVAVTALMAGAGPAGAAGSTTYAYPSGTASSGCTTVAGDCGLQAAINAAGDGGTVVLESDSSGATFTTPSGFTISQNSLTIEAATGVAPILAAGNSGTPQVLDATGTGTLTVQDVTIHGDGGTVTYGIQSAQSAGAVSVTDSTITDTYRGIDASGAVTVTDSTITGNSYSGSTPTPGR